MLIERIYSCVTDSSIKLFNYVSLCLNIGDNHDTKKLLIKNI